MKTTKPVEKLLRTQERLVRQSNTAWACGVRAEYKHQERARNRYYKKTVRLNGLARAAHKVLIQLQPQFGWSQP